MENKIYEVLRKHKLPLTKREEIIIDLLCLVKTGFRDLPENNNNLGATCKLDFNRSGCKHQAQNYGCNNEVNCMYKINKL